MGRGSFWNDLSRTELGCWRLTLKHQQSITENKAVFKVITEACLIKFWALYASMSFYAVRLENSPALLSELFTIDPFLKRHRLVHNGGFPNLEAMYCSLNMVNSTEI